MFKKKKKFVVDHNYLEKVPVRADLKWTTNDEGKVTLWIHNTALLQKLTQKIFFKPEYSQVHLDFNGSFVWPLIDGERNIIEIGELVKEHFGDAAEPLYERLVKFFEILKSYNFIYFKDEMEALEAKKNKKKNKKK